jgi:hypothetical protein
VIDAYRRGYQCGFAIAQEQKANVLLSREELEPIARKAIELLIERGYAHLEPIEEAIPGYIDGHLAWLYSYIPRDTLEAHLSWGEPVTS